MTSPPKRILLVENDPDLLRAVTRRLRLAGYTVIPAESIAAARQALQDELIHLAIIDIRATNDRNESDTSGFTLARELPASIPCLFHTAHDTKDHIREALGAIGADDIIAKDDPDAPAKLVARVHTMFQESVALNFALTLTSTVDLAEIATSMGSTLATDRAKPSGDDIDLIIRRLFRQALTVDLAPLLKPATQSGYSSSGAVLLRVHEARIEGHPVPMVLKVGPAALIADEAERYRTIQPFLGGQRLARLEGEAYSRQVGGLLYTLVGAQDWESIRSLAVHLQNDEPATVHPLPTSPASRGGVPIARPRVPLGRGEGMGGVGERVPATVHDLLTRFLEQTFRAIYQEAQPTTLDLMVEYTHSLGLTVDKLQRALTEWKPAALTADTLQFDGLTQPLRNPVTWAVQGAHFRSWGMVESYTVLCHGDLHSRNVLVDGEGHCWLIDFGRSGRSHLLRDFVELESDIRLQFAPGHPSAELLLFEESLLTANAWQPPADAMALPPALQRARQLIATVRSSAVELTVGLAQTEEYQQALFWHLLNALRLRALSREQKEYALLAASVVGRWLADDTE